MHARSFVITGASTGIGRSAALHLDRLGHRVIAGVRNPGDGDALRTSASERLTPVVLDVTDADDIAQAVQVVDDALGGGPLDGLVNNAGISLGGPLEFLDIDRLRLQLEVNVVGLVAVTQALLPLLRRGPGRIVNIGSIGGRVTSPFMGPYCASKYAVEALSDALRMELGPWGIHVSVVEPGPVHSPIWDKGREQYREYAAAMPARARALRAVPGAHRGGDRGAHPHRRAHDRHRPCDRARLARVAAAHALLGGHRGQAGRGHALDPARSLARPGGGQPVIRRSKGAHRRGRFQRNSSPWGLQRSSSPWGSNGALSPGRGGA